MFLKPQILYSSKLKEFADYNFEFDENGREFSKRIENALGKREIARNKQFLLFPTEFLKDLYIRHRNTRDCTGKITLSQFSPSSALSKLMFSHVEDVHFYGLLDAFCCTCTFHISP